MRGGARLPLSIDTRNRDPRRRLPSQIQGPSWRRTLTSPTPDGEGPRNPPVDPDADAPTLTLAGGRYRVDGLLGEGGMGRVFSGHDAQLRRAVAIKAIRSGTAAALLRDEARAMARLHHPNVVDVFPTARRDRHSQRCAGRRGRHGNSTQAPMADWLEHSPGSWPGAYQGTHVVANSKPGHGSGPAGSQNGAQQPLPSHAGTISASAQKLPASQTLRNSHGSPIAPSVPEASGAQAKLP